MARRRVLTRSLVAAVLIVLVASTHGVEEASELSVAADGRASEAAPSDPSTAAPALVADDEAAPSAASVTGKPSVQPETGEGDAPEPSRESQAVEAITLELEELDRLMDVAQRQAKALQRMRQLIIDGAALPPPTGRRVLPAESLDADSSSSLSRRRGGDQGRRRTPRGFKDYFMQKANVTLQGYNIEAVELMSVRARRPRGASKRSPLGAIFLVVVAGDDGNFHFFDKAGMELLVVPTGHEAPITALAHDFTDVPAVFSAAADGTVRVATLNVWFDGKLIAGRLPRNALHGRAPLPKHNTIHKEVLQAAEEDHAREAEHVDPTFQPAGLGLSLHLSLFAKWTAADDVAGAVARLDEEVAAQVSPDVARGDGAIITALSAYHYSQKRMVVAATSTGVIAVHLFNGTLMRAFHYTQGHRLARTQVQEGAPVPPPLPPPTFDEPITAVARYGAQIAYAVRGDVHFLNLVRPSRAHAEQRKCEGPGSEIVAMQFDFMRSAYLWVSTASGDLLAYDTRAKMQTASTCKLLHRQASSDGKPVSVASIRGYVLSLSTASTEVFNTTTVEAGNVDWVFTHARSSDATSDGITPAARSVAVGGRMSASHQTMVLLADIGGASFELHESLLPYHPEHYDIGWIRGPLLAVAVAVVIGYQVLKRRGSDAPGPSVEEIAKTLRVPGADGSLGGASGGRFSRGGGLGSRAGIGSRGGQPAFR